ncbi:MAG: Kelch repeat-containing protein, partial [Alphaproteobacteria bacterium]
SWGVAPFRLPSPRAGLAAAYLDGRIYVAGGGSGGNAARLDILDLETGSWRRGAPLPGGRSGLAMAVVGDRLHVVGGASIEDLQTYDSHFAYDPAEDRWTALAPMPTPRHGMASAQVDGRLYVLGGGSGAGFFTVFTGADVVEMYDPQAE